MFFGIKNILVNIAVRTVCNQAVEIKLQADRQLYFIFLSRLQSLDEQKHTFFYISSIYLIQFQYLLTTLQFKIASSHT